MSRIVVAIDGPAGAGKSTVTKRLAAALGYRLLDTGALYRAIALLARRRGVDWADERRLAELAASLQVRFQLDGDQNRVFADEIEITSEIRTPEISDGSSRVSALPEVRAALLDLQRRIGRQGGVVAEGRDVGTVVFPDAGAKFFLTASPQVRAERRLLELQAAGRPVNYESTLAEMQARDERDSGRDVAPLTAAADAVVVDSSQLSLDEVVARMLAIVRAREQA